MHTYNSTLEKIKLPEYGRNLESLIDYCKTIPERDKRTRYAYGIVEFMARLKSIDHPSEAQMRVFWDHLALLSNFELDIDYPYPIIPKTHIEAKPEAIKRELPKIKFRQYGLVVERMLEVAASMEDEDKRVRLMELCANHMKLQFHLANKDADEDDNKIIHDLIEYLGPEFKDDCYRIFLYTNEELKENDQYKVTAPEPAPTKKKKKKKKKKASA